MNEHLLKVASHHDWWSQTYDSDYFSYLSLYHRITLDNIRRFLPAKKCKPILDAGGGTGIWSIELAKLGYNVVLIDISQEMMQKAREKIADLQLDNQIEMKIADICSLPEFKDEQFSMVLCEGDPLSYCGNHHAAIQELVRVVEISGIVIASVDNKTSALSWLREKTDCLAIQRLLETGQVIMPTNNEEFSYDIHAFTSEELKALFESNGMIVERMIGKPVIAHRLPALNKSDNPVEKEWLYQMELKFNDNPAFLPWGGHLEVVGRKK